MTDQSSQLLSAKAEYVALAVELIESAHRYLDRRVLAHVLRTKMDWSDAHELFTWPMGHFGRGLETLFNEHHRIYLPKKFGHDVSGLALSVPLLRYLAEMTANICFMIAAPSEQIRSERLAQWRASRHVILPTSSSHNWWIDVDKLPKRARKKVKLSHLVSKGGSLAAMEQRRGAPVAQRDVRFEDVFGSNFFEKALSIPMVNRSLFEERYKIWSYISKGNAYSLLPASFAFVCPLHDAIQLLTAYGKCCSTFLGRQAFPTDFIERLMKHEELAREGELNAPS